MIKRFIKFILFLISPELKEAVVYEKTKIEKWKEYAENLVVSIGINLENVIVHPYGQFGSCGLTSKRYLKKEFNGNHYKIEIPILASTYMIVPEITGWYEFYVWLHEIGHYIYKHYEKNNENLYYQEYEAEKFSLKIAKESELVNYLDFIDMKYSAISYLYSHIDKAIVKGEIKKIEDIPIEVKEFLYQSVYMKEILKDKFTEYVN